MKLETLRLELAKWCRDLGAFLRRVRAMGSSAAGSVDTRAMLAFRRLAESGRRPSQMARCEIQLERYFLRTIDPLKPPAANVPEIANPSSPPPSVQPEFEPERCDQGYCRHSTPRSQSRHLSKAATPYLHPSTTRPPP